MKVLDNPKQIRELAKFYRIGVCPIAPFTVSSRTLEISTEMSLIWMDDISDSIVPCWRKKGECSR